MPKSDNDKRLKSKLKAVKRKKARRERQIRADLPKANPKKLEDIALKIKLLDCINQIIVRAGIKDQRFRRFDEQQLMGILKARHTRAELPESGAHSV
jgi:hypothetical protein